MRLYILLKLAASGEREGDAEIERDRHRIMRVRATIEAEGRLTREQFYGLCERVVHR